MLTTAIDAMSVRHVFGDPIHTTDALLIPVASVAGGAGGGGGEDAEGGRSGSGGGSGFTSVPVGLYCITGDRVSWHPAVDVNAIVRGSPLLAAVALLIAARRRHKS